MNWSWFWAILAVALVGGGIVAWAVAAVRHALGVDRVSAALDEDDQ